MADDDDDDDGDGDGSIDQAFAGGRRPRVIGVWCRVTNMSSMSRRFFFPGVESCLFAQTGRGGRRFPWGEPTKCQNKVAA